MLLICFGIIVLNIYSQSHFILKPVIAMPCPLSRDHMNIVNQCPRNSLEWDARSAIYNCSSVNQTCVQKDMFVYHCVVNPNQTIFIEVCAPLKYIYGNIVLYYTLYLICNQIIYI